MSSNSKLTNNAVSASATKILHFRPQTVTTKWHWSLLKKLSKCFLYLAVFRGKKSGGGDILCEMRFHVLNNELDNYYEKKGKEEKVKKEEETKDAKGSDDEEEDGEQMTAAKLFNQKILDRANIGQFAGEIVCSIQDLPMIIPRGNYSLEFYSNFCKLHGKTHDYRIMFKDISKIFLLQKPDGVKMV